MFLTLGDSVLFALQTLSKSLRLRKGLATTSIQEPVLTLLSCLLWGKDYRQQLLLPGLCQLQLGIPTEWAGESPMLQHKPDSLSYSSTNKTHWTGRVYSHSLPQASQNQLWKTHEKDSMKQSKLCSSYSFVFVKYHILKKLKMKRYSLLLPLWNVICKMHS